MGVQTLDRAFGVLTCLGHSGEQGMRLIDLQRALVSLPGQCPLLLICVHLGKIVQQGGDIGRRGAGGLQNIQAAIVKFLCVGESALPEPELAQRPERVSRLLAAGAEIALRKMQCLLQRRLRAVEIACM